MVPSLIMLHLQDKIPNESTVFVKDKLKKLDKMGLAKIVVGMPALKLNDINIVFWIGSIMLGIFGVGRFMIGDRIIGFLKLFLLFLSYMLLIVGILVISQPSYGTFGLILMIMGYIGILACIVWWGIDIFLISAKARKHNLNKILRLFQY